MGQEVSLQPGKKWRRRNPRSGKRETGSIPPGKGGERNSQPREEGGWEEFPPREEVGEEVFPWWGKGRKRREGGEFPLQAKVEEGVAASLDLDRRR